VPIKFPVRRLILRPRLEDAVHFACLGFALWTVSTQIAVLARASLKTLIFFAGPLLAALVVLFTAFHDRFRDPENPSGGAGRARPSKAAGWSVAVVALAALIVTLVSHRPDIDDSLYVNLAVGCAENPSQPLLAQNTLYDLPDVRVSIVVKFQSLEILAGAVSYLTGLPALAIIHLIFSGLAALMFAAGNAVLIRFLRVKNPTWTLAALFVVLLSLGQSHRAYGNFAFVRLFQGKSIYVTVVISLLIFYSLRFARSGRWEDWILLVSAQICGLGLTSSSLFLTPFIVAAALLAGRLPTDCGGLRRLAAGLLSCFYLAGAAVLFISQASQAPSLARPLPVHSDRLGFMATMAWTVLGSGRALAAASFIVLTAWFIVRTPLARRLAVVFPALFLLFFLNPLLLDFNLRWFPAAEEVYWRIFWAVPFPLIAALYLSSPLEWTRPLLRKARWGAAFGLLLIFLAVFPENTLRPANGVRIGVPRLKVLPPYAAAAEIARSVPRRSLILAPNDVNVWAGTVQPQIFPLTVRGYYLSTIERIYGPEELERRTLLVEFISGGNNSATARRLFQAEVGKRALSAVCFARSLEWKGDVVETLKRNRYIRRRGVGRYDIWIRKPPRAPSKKPPGDRRTRRLV
jgi:hypothetical protein